jgi:hypothetical protein
LTCGGDTATTVHILRTGGVETWLPTQNPAAAGAIAGGTCVAGMHGVSKLAETHPKAAKVVGWSLVAFRGSIVYHNLDQIRRHQ